MKIKDRGQSENHLKMWFLPFWKSKNIEEIGPINLGAIFRDTNEARLGVMVRNYQG